MSRNKQLSIVGALLLVIGFAAGALSVAILRPPVKVVQGPVAQPVGQPKPQPMPMQALEPQAVPAEPAPQPQLRRADTKDIPRALVAFIRERIEKNSDSGQWEEIEWQHHVGQAPETRVSDLALPVAVGGHGATLEFRTVNGGVGRRGWISAAQYAPEHFDWCGVFDGDIFNPDFSMPSEKPLLRNDMERAEEMLDDQLEKVFRQRRGK